MSSRDGPIIRQGPHHSAQKSTSTGVSDFRTSCSKEASVALTVIVVLPKTLQAGRWTGAALGQKLGSESREVKPRQRKVLSYQAFSHRSPTIPVLPSTRG